MKRKKKGFRGEQQEEKRKGPKEEKRIISYSVVRRWNRQMCSGGEKNKPSDNLVNAQGGGGYGGGTGEGRRLSTLPVECLDRVGREPQRRKNYKRGDGEGWGYSFSLPHNRDKECSQISFQESFCKVKKRRKGA